MVLPLPPLLRTLEKNGERREESTNEESDEVFSSIECTNILTKDQMHGIHLA